VSLLPVAELTSAAGELEPPVRPGKGFLELEQPLSPDLRRVCPILQEYDQQDDRSVDEAAARLGLSADEMSAITTEFVRVSIPELMKLIEDTIKSGFLLPEVDLQLKALLSRHAGIKLNARLESALEDCRRAWTARQAGSLEEINVDIPLQKGEKCYLQLAAKWWEDRNGSASLPGCKTVCRRALNRPGRNLLRGGAMDYKQALFTVFTLILGGVVGYVASFFSSRTQRRQEFRNTVLIGTAITILDEVLSNIAAVYWLAAGGTDLRPYWPPYEGKDSKPRDSNISARMDMLRLMRERVFTAGARFAALGNKQAEARFSELIVVYTNFLQLTWQDPSQPNYRANLDASLKTATGLVGKIQQYLYESA